MTTSDEPLNDERRAAPRITLQKAVEVQDATTGVPLGRMLNLSRTGFMLLTQRPMTKGREMNFALQIPGHPPVNLTAECIWCQRSSYSDTYGAGFRMQEISEAARQLIIKLLSMGE